MIYTVENSVPSKNNLDSKSPIIIGACKSNLLSSLGK